MSEPIEILLVEDNPGDARLTEVALSESVAPNRLSIVADGERAVAFLRREPGYEDAPRPDLILLDLNMPRMNGHEVLAEVKSDPDLRAIPIVVLTTSTSDRDISESYRLQANSFINKPVDLSAFFDVVRAIEDYWLGASHLPVVPKRGPSS